MPVTFPGEPLAFLIEAAFGADLTAPPSSWTWTDITPWWNDPDPITLTWGRKDRAKQAEPVQLTFRLDNTDGRFTPEDPRSPYWPHVVEQVPLRFRIDPGTGLIERFSGFIAAWPMSWLAPTPHKSVIQVTAHGVTRRLGQGAAPLRSALYRTIARTNPVAYWPLEDGKGSTQAASGIRGGQPLQTTGTVNFAEADGPAGSAPLAEQTTNSRLFGSVPPGSTSSSWRLEYVVRFPAEPSPLFTDTLVWQTAGSISAWGISFADLVDGGPFLQYLTATGDVSPTFHSNIEVRDGQWHHIRVRAEQVGSDIDVLVDFDGLNQIAELITGETLGRVTGVTLNPTSPADELLPYSIGHLAIWAPWNDALSNQLILDAFQGHPGEAAAERIARLCTEEGIPVTILGDPAQSEPMGPQPTATLLEILQQGESADKGYLADTTGHGITYLPRAALYNQPAALELDADRGELAWPFEPVLDDAATRNEWTVGREGGSEATAVDTEHQRSRGRYADSETINVSGDEVLPHHAAWLVHLGTTRGLRYPALNIDLTRHPNLIPAWLTVRPSSRLQAVNLPPQHPLGGFDQLIDGATESITRRTWTVTTNVRPARPWDVAVCDVDRYDTAGSTLTASIPSVATVAFVADAETNNATSTPSVVVNVPAGTRRGDVMVALVGKIDQGAITPPAGWTLIGSQLAGSNVIYEAYYRVAQASEPANYTWSWGVNVKNVGWIGSYRNVDVTAPIAGFASLGSNTPGASFSTPVTGAVPAGAFIIRAVFERHPATGAANTWTSSGGTERMDLGSNGGTGQDDSAAVYDNSAGLGGVPAVRTLTASQTVNQVALWTICLKAASAMDISVATTSGPVWTYRGLDLPMNITIGGEVMAVDLIGDVLNANPYFTVDTSDWSVTSATSIIRSTAVVHPSGVASMLITPDGVSTTAGAIAGLSGSGTVVAGRSYIASGWVNIPTGYSDVRMAVDWYDAAGVFLSSGLDGQFSAAAAVWTPLTCTLVAPGSASQARLRVRLGATPPATALTYVWNAQLIDVTDSSTSPQRMRVTRNVNGVIKSQSSGSAVTLARPTYYAL